MRRIVASLAAVIASVALAGCGDDGAEPDVPERPSAPPAPVGAEVDLVLDFQPNAAHAGIYGAQQGGRFADLGDLRVRIREPGASTDAPKLLRSGRADLAILDIHDLAIARERGADLVGIGAIVHEPLAAVIAGDRDQIREPADLAGRKIGVTGLPSDDAVLASVLETDGLGLDDVETVTIGFESVPAVANGQVAAATAFWNAEGVALKDLGVPTREFRVDDFGAPTYPELVLVATAERIASDDGSLRAALRGIEQGYGDVVRDPEEGLTALLAAVPELKRGPQRRQLDAVLPAFRPEIDLDRNVLEAWADWDLEHGIVEQRPDVEAAFEFGFAP